MKHAQLKKVFWQEIATQVQQTNPALANAIAGTELSDAHYFYLAQYPYGVNILDEQGVYIPNPQGELALLNEQNFPADFVDEMSYAPIPLFFVLEKVVEIYVESPKQMIPLKVLKPGDCYCLWECLQPSVDLPPQSQRVCKLAAGVRSAFLLPKITDAEKHRQLQKSYKLLRALPQNLSEHWEIFNTLTQTDEITWHCQILFLPKIWFADLNRPSLSVFRAFLYEYGWQETLALRMKEILQYYWEDFVGVLNKQNLKIRPDLIDALKNVVYIAMGLSPGFLPCADAEEAFCPVSWIQKIYVEKYGLKQYMPTLMHCDHFSRAESQRPIYYSLQTPSLLKTYPQPQNIPSIISDLRVLENVIHLLYNHPQFKKTAIYSYLKNLNIEFFHTDADKNTDIQSTQYLIASDPSFAVGYHHDQIQPPIAKNAQFFRGVIKISGKGTQHDIDQH